MAQPEQVSAVQMIRWYTRARRFPQLVGTWPDGRRIPGGPYTITQVVLGAGLIVAGLSTRSFWGGRGVIADLFLLTAVAGGLVFAAGKLPLAGRNPIAAATGLIAVVGAPNYGRIGGRPVRLRPPMRLQHHVTIWATEAAAADPVAAAQDEAVTPVKQPAAAELAPHPQRDPRDVGDLRPVAAPLPVHSPLRAPLTGVQALLAARPAASESARRGGHPDADKNLESLGGR